MNCSKGCQALAWLRQTQCLLLFKLFWFTKMYLVAKIKKDRVSNFKWAVKKIYVRAFWLIDSNIDWLGRTASEVPLSAQYECASWQLSWVRWKRSAKVSKNLYFLHIWLSLQFQSKKIICYYWWKVGRISPGCWKLLLNYDCQLCASTTNVFRQLQNYHYFRHSSLVPQILLYRRREKCCIVNWLSERHDSARII